MSSSSSPRSPCMTGKPSDPARARSPGICLLLLPFHTWAVAALAGVSALAVMPPGRPEDAITATAVPA
jgi:hypothetical protein